MAADPRLLARLRRHLADEPGCEEKRMSTASGWALLLLALVLAAAALPMLRR